MLVSCQQNNPNVHLGELDLVEDLIENKGLLGFLRLNWLYFALKFEETKYITSELKERWTEERIMILLQTLHSANVSLDLFLKNLKDTLQFASSTQTDKTVP